MINLASMSFISPASVLSTSSLPLAKTSKSKHLSNCCKLLLCRPQCSSLRSEKVTNLHITIIFIFFLVCPRHTRLLTPITIIGLLNCYQLNDNNQQINRMEGKSPMEIKGCF